MLQLYSDLLHRLKPKLQSLPKLKKIFDGSINDIYTGLETMLDEKPTICSRIELVWSAEKKKVSGVSNTSELFDLALAECNVFAEMTDCTNPEQYQYLHIENFIEYVKNVLLPLFNTIEINRKKLLSFYESVDTSKVWRPVNIDHFLSLKNFVDVYVSEGFIQLFLRGDMSAYPKILETALKEDPEEDALHSWPFKENLVERMPNNTIESTFHITKFWRKFCDKFFEKKQPGKNKLPFHCIQMIEMYQTYAEWHKTPPNPIDQLEKVSIRLFNSLCYALFQKVLAINKEFADNPKALEKIWDDGNIGPDQHMEIVASKEIYHIITTKKSVYNVLGLVEIRNFFEYLRHTAADRAQGGFRLPFAVCLDNLMVRFRKPFLLRIPENIANKLYVFAPVTFSQVNDTLVKMYRGLFDAKYHRTKGDQGVDVERYLRPLLEYLAGLYKERETPDIGTIIDIIHELLDKEDVRNSTRYLSLKPEIQRILHPDQLPLFLLPTVPRRRRRADETDDENDDQDDEAAGAMAGAVMQSPRVTRSVARRKRQINALIAEGFNARGQQEYDEFMKETFSSPPPSTVVQPAATATVATVSTIAVPIPTMPTVAVPISTVPISTVPISTVPIGPVSTGLVPFPPTPGPYKRIRLISTSSRVSSKSSSDGSAVPHVSTPRPPHPPPRRLNLDDDGSSSDDASRDRVN